MFEISKGVRLDKLGHCFSCLVNQWFNASALIVKLQYDTHLISVLENQFLVREVGNDHSQKIGGHDRCLLKSRRLPSAPHGLCDPGRVADGFILCNGCNVAIGNNIKRQLLTISEETLRRLGGQQNTPSDLPYIFRYDWFNNILSFSNGKIPKYLSFNFFLFCYFGISTFLRISI